MKAIHVVFDTNIFISGMLWGGKPGHLIDALAAGRLIVYVTEEILEELKTALQRTKFLSRLAIKQLNPDVLLKKTRALVTTVRPSSVDLPASLRDRDDLHILACAVSCAATMIVTGDKDLLIMGSFDGIPILNASGAIERLGC